jgi:RND family efflux transporter MFP subunit
VQCVYFLVELILNPINSKTSTTTTMKVGRVVVPKTDGTISNMNLQRKNLITVIIVTIFTVDIMLTVQASEDSKNYIDALKPVLTVTTGKPQISRWARTLSANGNVAAWQEAIIGNETNGLRLVDVRVNVGDVVQKGQVLALFERNTLVAGLAQAQANVAEAKANFAQAAANGKIGRGMQDNGALSRQKINEYLTVEQAAKARLEAQQAIVKVQLLQLAQTQVLAPDNGVISSRSATVGAVLPRGQELFRLIRQGRLEWRSEVVSSELAQLKPGDPASILAPDGSRVNGKVRMIAPTVDPQTRLGIVYVDLPSHPALKAGMFAKGAFELGSSEAITVLQQAVVLRDGFSYVFKLGTDNLVTQVKVQIGRRSNDQVEILDGLQPDDVIVTNGAGFLNDRDLVRLTALPATVKSGSAESNP